MNKNRTSYSNTTSDSNESMFTGDKNYYDMERSRKEDDSHNAFGKSDYSTRKMTFEKIIYVHK